MDQHEFGRHILGIMYREDVHSLLDVELYQMEQTIVKSPGNPHPPPKLNSFPKKKISHSAERDVLLENPTRKQFPTRRLFGVLLFRSSYCRR